MTFPKPRFSFRFRRPLCISFSIFPFFSSSLSFSVFPFFLLLFIPSLTLYIYLSLFLSVFCLYLFLYFFVSLFLFIPSLFSLSLYSLSFSLYRSLFLSLSHTHTLSFKCCNRDITTEDPKRIF